MSDPAITVEHPDTEGAVSLSTAKAGMAAFLCSEAAFFSTLIVAYVTYLGQSATGPRPADVLSLPLVALNSAFLLTSSGTIALAMRAHGRRPPVVFTLWMLITVLLGGLFLAGTGYEWYRLIFHDGLTIGRNLFGTTFFTLIGFHAAHVTIGLIAISAALALDRTAAMRPTSEALELVSWYWHFVDSVWIVILMVVYLFGR